MLVLFLIEFFCAKNKKENLVLFTPSNPHKVTFICCALKNFMKRNSFTSKHIYLIEFTSDLYSKKESLDYKKFVEYLKEIQKTILILENKEYFMETNELFIHSKQSLKKILYDKNVAFLIRMEGESYVYIEITYRNTVLRYSKGAFI